MNCRYLRVRSVVAESDAGPGGVGAGGGALVEDLGYSVVRVVGEVGGLVLAVGDFVGPAGTVVANGGAQYAAGGAAAGGLGYGGDLAQAVVAVGGGVAGSAGSRAQLAGDRPTVGGRALVGLRGRADVAEIPFGYPYRSQRGRGLRRSRDASPLLSTYPPQRRRCAP